MASFGGEDEDGLISGINVTPLVDVTLVILVIFMVTAPIMVAKGMPMDLPKAASGETIQTVFSVELTQDGGLYVDSKKVSGSDALRALAKKEKQAHPDVRATIRADKKVEHGQVMTVLDDLNRAGISKIAFAVAPDAKPAGEVGVEPSPSPEKDAAPGAPTGGN